MPARADIVVDPEHTDVSPDLSGWNANVNGYVGKTASGKLTVTGGSDLSSNTSHVGSESDSTGVVIVNGIGSTWTNTYDLTVGYSGNGTLNITGGSVVSNRYGHIGRESVSEGEVTVNGAGSTWTNGSWLNVGRDGSGTLDITGGGTVSSVGGIIGECSGSEGVVTVDGAGSKWTNSGRLSIGYAGGGTLNIVGGGLVSVAGNDDGLIGTNGFVNMKTGGMLALNGDAAGSLATFLGWIEGSCAIRYRNDSDDGWINFTGTTDDEHYTLRVGTVDEGLAGYTVLTVPEPATIALLSFGFAGMAAIRRRRWDRD